MADPQRATARPHRRGVASRLAIAFVAVSLMAVALFAALTVVVESHDVDGLARQQATDLANVVAAASATAYRQHDSWSGADLSDAVAAADAVGGHVVISDPGGATVAENVGPRPGAETAAKAEAAIDVDGRRVGEVSLAIGSAGVGHADAHLRHSLILGLAASAAAAGLLAVGAALIVAERITRPLRRLRSVAAQMTAGRRDIRVGELSAPRELSDLGAAYDTLADTIEKEDRLRRTAAAHAAHELRTPVAIILATCESILDGISDPTPATFSSLRDEALRLTARVEDLETLASAEAAALTLERRPVDLGAVAEQAAEALAARFDASGVILRRRIGPVLVAGDAGRLHQVVTNLLTNAAKFAPEGSVVDLSVGSEAGLGVLEVTDDGPGVDGDEISHLFEPFWRGRAAASTAGSGIGLAVVAQLVAAHGGQVSLGAPDGAATTFRVVLPLLSSTSPVGA